MFGKIIGATLLVLLLIGCAVPAQEPPRATTTARPTLVPPTATALSQSSATNAIPTNSMPTALPQPSASRASPTLSIPTAPAMPIGVIARLNEPFTLKVSESVAVPEANSLRVYFTNVLEDSRCPPNIACYQAGRVRVLITVVHNAKLAQFDFSTALGDYRRQGTLGGYLVELLDVAPPPNPANTPMPRPEYRVTLRVTAGSLARTRARVNEPFTIKLGKTVEFENSPLRITFDSVAQDSRCPTRATCATSGAATLALRLTHNDASQSMSVDVRGNGVLTNFPVVRSVAFTVYAQALTPYPQIEFASKEISLDEYEATLLVVNPVAAPGTPTSRDATAIPLAACAELTRGDASEILGEPIQAAPQEMILFPSPNSLVDVRGLCGYGSVAFTPNKPAAKNVPSVTPVSARADHAVIAGKFTDAKRIEQLLSIAGVIHAANPRSDGVLINKLIALSAAGVWSRDLLDDFPNAARDASEVRVRSASGFGDKAIWVWREWNAGRYAALVAQKGDTLFVLAALTDEHRAEESVFLTASSVMQKMIR